MNRNDAIDLARGHALCHGQTGDHAYLPSTDAEAAEWLPHAWVVDAIVSAVHERDISLRIKIEEHDCCAEDLMKMRQLCAELADVIAAAMREHHEDACKPGWWDGAVKVLGPNVANEAGPTA